jgi:hypothetical protein
VECCELIVVALLLLTHELREINQVAADLTERLIELLQKFLPFDSISKTDIRFESLLLRVVRIKKLLDGMERLTQNTEGLVCNFLQIERVDVATLILSHLHLIVKLCLEVLKIRAVVLCRKWQVLSRHLCSCVIFKTLKRLLSTHFKILFWF